MERALERSERVVDVSAARLDNIVPSLRHEVERTMIRRAAAGISAGYAKTEAFLSS